MMKDQKVSPKLVFDFYNARPEKLPKVELRRKEEICKTDILCENKKKFKMFSLSSS
jgi:hypothetical protein